MNILHIDSCALGDNSSSRLATAAAAAALMAAHEHATFQYRDLAAAPLSHASGPLLQVLSDRWNSDIPMNAELSAEVLQSVALMQEFVDADIVLIGAPMHNFSVPSTLKAWLDRLLELRATANLQRLASVRVLLTTSGCTEATQDDLLSHHETQLIAAFRFIGVEQVTIVRNTLELQQPGAFPSAA
jgi:FMN-dependent NADH-azoreductase